jgi:TetR/AcrR family transcriptional regulator, repressor of fatR-cypB operon
VVSQGPVPAGAAADANRRSTRDAVLDAALAVFTEHTYNGTAVPLVAERAGAAVGTIYRHFPSKQALVNAVFQHWKRQMLEYLTRGADPGEPVRAEFGRLWSALRAFATDHPTAFAFLEHQQHEGYLDAESTALSEQATALATDLVLRGQRAGQIRPGDPAVLVALVYGAFVGLSKAIRGGAVVGDEGFTAAERAVWDLLRAPERPRQPTP